MRRIGDFLSSATGHLFGNPPPATDDDLFPEHEMPACLNSERDALRRGGATDNQVQAFVIAQKLCATLCEGDVKTARQMAYTAMQLDPLCFDAYQGILMCMKNPLETGGHICGYREILHAMQRFCRPLFATAAGRFQAEMCTRPYIRTLMMIVLCASDAFRYDLLTYAYEEFVRLANDDERRARNPLVGCYLKLIGRRRRVPETRPIRTFAHVEGLLAARFGGRPLFGEAKNEPLLRWARIFMAYDRGEDWKTLVLAENAKSKLFMQVALREVEESTLPVDEANPGYLQAERADAPWVFESLVEWPDFLILVHDLIRKPDRRYAEYFREKAPDPRKLQEPAHVQELRNKVATALQKGREELAGAHFERALRQSREARSGMDDIN
jgi:hypothetical protein